jgi:hypothetical protein
MVLTCGCMLSVYRCMRGSLVDPTVVCMGNLHSLWMLVRWHVCPLHFFGLQNFSLRRLVCEGTICMWLWCPILICVYSEAQTVKFLLVVLYLYLSEHCVITGGIIIKKKLCTNYHTWRVTWNSVQNEIIYQEPHNQDQALLSVTGPIKKSSQINVFKIYCKPA